MPSSKREKQRLEPTPQAAQVPEPASAVQRPGPQANYAQQLDALRANDQQTGGEALDSEMQAEFGTRLGHDFGGVRIFPEARSAGALGANAYAHGSDIFFGPGRFAPHTGQGRALLAHELTHVAQQARGPATATADAAESEAQAAGQLAAAGQPAPVQQAVAPGVQREPMSVVDTRLHIIRLEEKLKQPDLPKDEAQRIETELAGARKSLRGEDHDPKTYEGAGFIMRQVATLIHIYNMNGTPWDPTKLPPVPSPYSWMLWQFWKVQSGYEWVNHKEVQLSGAARRARLHEGLEIARPLIARLEAGGAQDWLERNFWKWYYKLEADTYFSEARELAEGSVADAQARQDPSTVPKITGEVEQARGAVMTGRETLSRLLQLVTRFQGGQMEAELAKVMANLRSGSTLPQALEGVKTMKFTQAAFYLRGVLNTIDAVLVFENIGDREKAALRHPNLFAAGTDIIWQIGRILEGTVVLTAGLTATVAKLAGMATEATVALQMGSRTLRVIGTIGSAFQVLYGFSVLLDPDATSAQRRSALFNIGLGGAGIGSLPALWGGSRLWASGPWTIAVLWGGLVAGYMNAMTSLAKQGLAARGLYWSFGSLQLEANHITDSARPLEAALFHLRFLPQATGDHPESSLHAGMETVARLQTDSLRETLGDTVKLTTERSDWFLEREPGDFHELRKRFVPLKEKLQQAKTSEDVLGMAVLTLETIRTAFQEADQVFQATMARHQ